MGRSQDLSERGSVIGCHLCNKSSPEIPSVLNIPQSTVSGTRTQWERLGRQQDVHMCVKADENTAANIV